MVRMKKRKGMGMFGIIAAGLLIIGIVYIFSAVPWALKVLKIKQQTDLFVNLNDDAGKFVPLLKARTSDLSFAEMFACEISGIDGCGDEEEIDRVVRDMDTEILLYSGGKEVKSYGEKTTGGIFLVEMPLPGGNVSTVGIRLEIASAQPLSTGWIWPVGGDSGVMLSHCYGEKRIKTRTGEPYTHSGIDIGGSRGDPIYAVSDGIVRYTCTGAKDGERGVCHGYGNMVVVEHGDYFARYSHLYKLAEGISVGSKLEKGDLVGYMGNTGYSFGDHLDFKVYSHDPGRWGYNADIDPICMFDRSYLDDKVKVTYLQGDDDCSKAGTVCSTMSASSYDTQYDEDD